MLSCGFPGGTVCAKHCAAIAQTTLQQHCLCWHACDIVTNALGGRHWVTRHVFEDDLQRQLSISAQQHMHTLMLQPLPDHSRLSRRNHVTVCFISQNKKAVSSMAVCGSCLPTDPCYLATGCSDHMCTLNQPHMARMQPTKYLAAPHFHQQRPTLREQWSRNSLIVQTKVAHQPSLLHVPEQANLTSTCYTEPLHVSTAAVSHCSLNTPQ